MQYSAISPPERMEKLAGSFSKRISESLGTKRTPLIMASLTSISLYGSSRGDPVIVKAIRDDTYQLLKAIGHSYVIAQCVVSNREATEEVMLSECAFALLHIKNLQRELKLEEQTNRTDDQIKKAAIQLGSEFLSVLITMLEAKKNSLQPPPETVLIPLESSSHRSDCITLSVPELLEKAGEIYCEAVEAFLRDCKDKLSERRRKRLEEFGQVAIASTRSAEKGEIAAIVFSYANTGWKPGKRLLFVKQHEKREDATREIVAETLSSPSARIPLSPKLRRFAERRVLAPPQAYKVYNNHTLTSAIDLIETTFQQLFTDFIKAEETRLRTKGPTFLVTDSNISAVIDGEKIRISFFNPTSLTWVLAIGDLTEAIVESGALKKRELLSYLRQIVKIIAELKKEIIHRESGQDATELNQFLEIINQFCKEQISRLKVKKNKLEPVKSSDHFRQSVRVQREELLKKHDSLWEESCREGFKILADRFGAGELTKYIESGAFVVSTPRRSIESHPIKRFIENRALPGQITFVPAGLTYGAMFREAAVHGATRVVGSHTPLGDDGVEQDILAEKINQRMAKHRAGDRNDGDSRTRDDRIM